MADVVVTDTLPPGVVVTNVDSTIPGTSCNSSPDNGQVNCTLSLGAANQCAATPLATSGTITIEAKVQPSAVPGDNVATIAAGTCGTDPNLTQNSDTLALLVVNIQAPALHNAALAALAAILAAAGAVRLRRRTR
jgi:hypothetical protein